MKTLFTAFCWMLLTASHARAAQIEIQIADKAPSPELGAAIRETLQNKAIEIKDGGQPIYTLWLRKELPLKFPADSPAKALNAISETTLIGAAQVHGTQRDYRDNEIPKGFYTLRYALQPQDGDHLGTATYPFFLVLIPAKSDPSPDAITGFKAMTKASGRSTATGHPSVLSVRPPSTNEGAIPRLVEPEPEHQAVLLKTPTRAPGASEQGSLVFELVFAGHTSHL